MPMIEPAANGLDAALPPPRFAVAPTPRGRAVEHDAEPDLLSILPDSLYRRDWLRLTRSGREIFLINEPNGIRQVLVTEEHNFPKSDLMRATLEPLIGEGILITNGPVWQRQRRMLEGAFARLHVQRQFPVMASAIADLIGRLQRLRPGAEIKLDAEMSFFSLDVIFRALFSRPIDEREMDEVFNAFSAYQDLAPRDESYTMFMTSNAAPHAQETLHAYGERLHALIERLVDRRLASAPNGSSDMLHDLIAARDAESGAGLGRRELIDQIAVLFLAGQETTASALAWCMFLLAQSPALAEEIRRDTEALAPGRTLTQLEVNKLASLRNAFRETVRLYPPSAFFTRTAKAATRIGALDIEAGSLIIVSPWLIHRHEKFWTEPDSFDPDRFAGERELGIVPGTYIPFGLGPRVCTGRALAMNEGPLLAAELLRRFRFEVVEPEKVVPVYRLVVRSRHAIRCRIEPIAT
jgi:cytochrome P450